METLDVGKLRFQLVQYLSASTPSVSLYGEEQYGLRLGFPMAMLLLLTEMFILNSMCLICRMYNNLPTTDIMPMPNIAHP